MAPEVFLVDPWNNPYVYEFPRRDGHKGFLLFSKGPDGQASEFDSELTQTPKKEDMDRPITLGGDVEREEQLITRNRLLSLGPTKLEYLQL